MTSKSIKYYYIIFILLSAIQIGHSQEQKVTKRTITITEQGREPEKIRNSSLLNQYGVTIDPLRLISGELPVSLQYAVFDWLMFEVGTGLTYENYAGNVLGFDAVSYPSNLDYKVNVMYNLGIHFIPGGSVFDHGIHIGFEFRSRHYGGTAVEENNGTLYPVSFDAHYKDYGLIYGYYYELGLRMYLDLYVGASYRQVTSISESSLQPAPLYLDYGPISTQGLGLLYGLKVGWLIN